MRTWIVSALAASVALAAPALASAQNYDRDYPPFGQVSQECQQSVNNNRLAGGAIGAIAGAVIGKQVASRNARTEGQVLGAIVGAVAGSQIGKARVACDDPAYRDYGPAPRPQGARDPRDQFSYQAPEFRPSRRDHDHADRDRIYRSGYVAAPVVRQECGWGEAALRRPDGIYQRQQVWMCRDSDGGWRVID